MRTRAEDDRSLWHALVGDGRPLLVVVAISLVFAGAFAIFLAARGEFLPHDEAYLGQTADTLCRLADCRVVDFMLHDRAAFGGALMALGVLYLWLILFPLAHGERWAWWLTVVSGTIGFATFATYLLYGYLDSWHGWGTLALVPFATLGAVLTRRGLATGADRPLWLRPPPEPDPARRHGWQLVSMIAVGLFLVGGAILTVGIDAIFVPEDIEFIGLTRQQLDAANPNLVSLIAHDRVGFGSTILVGGLLGSVIALRTPVTRALWQALLLSGLLAFLPAIGVHHLVGYTAVTHLLPAYAGFVILGFGLAMSRPRRHG